MNDFLWTKVTVADFLFLGNYISLLSHSALCPLLNGY